ncbi:Subtilisin DY [Corynebacterium jeikeium]|nr:Subtilisin DY [Corynebacterium jeikeium]
MIIQDSSPHGNCQEGSVAAPGTVPLPDIDAPSYPALHALSRGQDVDVAVIDTGSAGPGVVGDRDFCILHGSVVTSVLRAIAPEAKVHSFRHNAVASRAEGTVEDLVRAIDRALKARVKVINISMVACEDTAELREAIGRAEKAGVLVVASTGNTGQCPEGAPTFPSSLDPVLAVGAVAPRKQELAGGIGTGAHANTQKSNSADQGRVPAQYSAPTHWVDVYAPGGPVEGQVEVRGKVHTIIGSPDPFEGTSFAAPVVSGTAALVWQIVPHLSVQEVRELLTTTATPGASGPGLGKQMLVISPAAAVDKALDLRDSRVRDSGVASSGNTSDGTADARYELQTVTTQPHQSEATDYSVPVVLSLVLALGIIATVVCRAFSADSKPPSGSEATRAN